MTKGVRIKCPNCGRILGDTDESINARLNCNGCKKTVRIKMLVASFKDYVQMKGEEHDES